MSSLNGGSPLFIHLDGRDSVVVALKELPQGTRLLIGQTEVVTRQTIPPGHKVAIRPIDSDQPVYKFGWPIGLSNGPIAPGEHVHSHNLRCDHTIDLEAISTEIPEAPEPIAGYTFEGYERPSGQVGTRNYLAVISSVNCSAYAARMIAQRFDAEALRAFPNVDGVVAFRHEGGCAMQYDGARHRMLARVLGGVAKHPNIGGFLLVGLGCEQGTLGHLVQSQGLHHIQLPRHMTAGSGAATNGNRNGASVQTVPMLSIQEEGGTRKTIERGVELVKQLLPQVNAARRTTVPASRLILGTNCGGSDGYSGITANPVLGRASDLIVACGGTTVLAETSEIYGAEQLLTRRARSAAVAHKLLERIDWWKWYCSIFGEDFDNNPSVGNKAGGLTTITEKSLGAVAKAGHTALEAVYEYGEPITAKGFVVMDSPGYDPASVTGLVASGVNLVAFTTGRGSCFGCKPVPSFKIASNSSLYHRMRDDMDFNAGAAVEGRSVDELGRELFLELLEVASGRKTKSEQLGIGDDEFVPWTVGPVL
ncbi:MAG: UxaA family hydrolase [Aureliella sp.]